MDRRRAAGIALILVSAAGFGSGSLFAQPVYAAGVDWLVLSAWRFLFGAGLAWVWLLASPDRRRGLRALDRRAVVVALGLGRPVRRQLRRVLRGPRDGLAVARRR